MKILHVDETFHPSYGYQVNPLAKFQQKQGNEVVIATVVKDWLYPVYKEFGDSGSELEEEDKIYEEATGVKIIRVPAKGYFMKRLVYGKEIFQVVDEVNPDVVFVHCVETLTAIRFLMRKMAYPMMFDSHMLAMASVNKFATAYEAVYRAFFARIIKKRKYDVIRTQDDPYVNDHLGMPKEQTPFISFGTDTILFKPSDEVRKQFRADYNISENNFVVVYTGKLTDAKGGKLLAETFLKKFDVPITLVCVGTPPDNDYGHEVQELLEQSENRVLMFPTQHYTELAKFYQAADLSIFPKQCSMSFYDAQACGLPVLSEDNNVNVDRCSNGNGSNFKSGNVEDFRKQLMLMANMDKELIQTYRKNARTFVEAGYDYADIAEQYTGYLKKAVERYK